MHVGEDLSAMISQTRHQLGFQYFILSNGRRKVERVRIETLRVVFNPAEEVVLQFLVALTLPFAGSNPDLDRVVEVAECARCALATAHGGMEESARRALLLRMKGGAYRGQLSVRAYRNSLHLGRIQLLAMPLCRSAAVDLFLQTLSFAYIALLDDFVQALLLQGRANLRIGHGAFNLTLGDWIRNLPTNTLTSAVTADLEKCVLDHELGSNFVRCRNVQQNMSVTAHKRISNSVWHAPG